MFKKIIIILLTLFFGAACAVRSADHPRAGILLQNGAIYTMDTSRSWADSVAVLGGKILYAGTRKGAGEYIGPATKVIDLKGAMVLPGFCDSHIHPIFGGIETSQCALFDLSTREEVFKAVKHYAESHREKSWILGSGWASFIFPGANPTKEELDRLVPDRPAFISSADGHSSWANSKALAMAGITKGTADPPGGRIERRAGTGEPSGTLRESASDLVEKLIPPATPGERLEALMTFLRKAGALGITSLVEANADKDELETYLELEKRGELTVRVTASLHVDPEKGAAQIPALMARRDRYRGPRVEAGMAKLFVDGVLETKTAALLEPYLQSGVDRGKLLIEPGPLNELVVLLDREGFQVHVHAIGDRGVRAALDAFQEALMKNGNGDRRHHIAHLELIDPADIPRFRRLGAVANCQPFWAFPDKYITELTEPIIGPARSRYLYPFGSIAKTGAILAAGSDWPVSTMNPLEAIQVAVTRKPPEEPGKPPLNADERLSLDEALAAYTIHGAYLRHHEKDTGSLEAGKAADLVVLERNLFETKPEELRKVKVLMTMLEGKWIFCDEAMKKAAEGNSL
ncbi:MAG: amidohydrolase [Candidatus Eremiobacteraeota bacterium]|nr:amidohydrolase [Candidatus Eremiobacteraeota bacterium]